MTPLEKARQQEQQGGCDTCTHCVEVNAAYFCEVSGKHLISRFMTIGHCMHNPSNYRRHNS